MPHNKTLTYEFGPYRLDLAQRVLTRNGETIALTPKATEILIMLVANAGQLVEKDELLKELGRHVCRRVESDAEHLSLDEQLGDERLVQSTSRQ